MFQTTITYIAWISTALFCIKLVLLLLGTDSNDADVDSIDLDGDHSSDISFKLLSFQSVVAFMMGFGWLGKACLEDWNLGKLPTIVISSLFGFVIMGIYILLMHLITKLNSVSNRSCDECVGKTATVYMGIPYRGLGQVEVSYGGKVSIVDAKGVDGDEIKSGTQVKVIAVKDKILLVKEV